MMQNALLILCGPPAALHAQERDVARRSTLTTRVRGSDFLVMSDVEADLLFPDGWGVVFGDVFGRRDLRRATGVSRQQAEAAAMSGGRRLVTDFWGDYVAALVEPGGTLHVVRSPFGAMTAYRLQHGEVEVIANDVGLLIDLGFLEPRVDWGFAAHFLVHPFTRVRRTGFEGLSELPPGSALTFAPGRAVVETRLWSPWDHVRPREDAHYPEMLGDVVRRCVRGWVEGRGRLLLELSGGLDSSVLAACLWDVGAQVTCVNMVSPARDGDERLFARAVAQKMGLALEEIDLQASDLDLTASPSIRRPRPSAHALLGAWDQALQQQATEHRIDAFVSGGGGDNVFFKTQTSTPAADALRLGALSSWTEAVRDLAALHGCSIWRAASMSIKRAMSPASQMWRPESRFVTQAIAETPVEIHPWLEGARGALPGKFEHLKGLMGAHNYLDAFPRSARAPMLTPLLSQPIVELCLSIPSWDWIAGGRDRAVTRDAFRSSLPPIVADRRSKGNLAGFAGPAFEAARSKLASHLIGGRLDGAGLLDVPALRKALQETGPPKGSDYFRILQIADVESWARRWT